MTTTTPVDAKPPGDRPLRVIPVESRRIVEIPVHVAPIRFVVVWPASFLIH